MSDNFLNKKHLDYPYKDHSKPYYDQNILFSKNLKSHIADYDKWNNELKENHISTLKSELNSLNFRSDEFVTKHSGKHILFSGCSQTWGTGLLLEELWSKKIYNFLCNDGRCSGYFNIGIYGTSIMSQIINMFKYFQTYGNPDVIFYNVPDILRSYVYDDKTKMFYDGFYSYKSEEIISLISYQYYYMLDQYCSANNIGLYSFSWVYDSKIKNYWDLDFKFPYFLKNFNTFYTMDTKKTLNFVFDYKEKNPKDKYVEFARDEKHLGTGFNAYWAEYMYTIYLLKEKNEL